MNRIIRSRLSRIAVLVAVSMAVVGCMDCNTCIEDICLPTLIFVQYCIAILCPKCIQGLDGSDCSAATSQICEDNPNECTATWEQMQLSAIQFCGENPGECQEAFDVWVESLEEAKE